MTIDDPTVFTRPFTVKMERLLAPDTELLEDVSETRGMLHICPATAGSD